MQLNEVSKISELAKSLYQHRLVGSMEEAAKLAEQMIGQDKSGEKMSAQSAEKEMPDSTNSDEYPELVPEVNAPLESYDAPTSETDASDDSSESNDILTNADPIESTSLNSDSLEQSEGPEQHKEEASTSEQEPADEWLESEEEEESEDEGTKEASEEVSKESGAQTSSTVAQDISPIDLSEELEGVKLTTEGAEHALEHLGNEVKSLKEQLEANTKEFEEIKEYLKDIEAIAESSKEAKKKEQAGLKTSEIADKPATEIDSNLDLT